MPAASARRARERERLRSRRLDSCKRIDSADAAARARMRPLAAAFARHAIAPTRARRIVGSIAPAAIGAAPQN
ncbi:hypothetical protein [Pseudomonas sp. CGJS7]|uniref:hypothetical protein n=1 Tax=Pseudomonas sp. CGJS7 TaxID=3109348 RepID=UPI00300A5109